MEQEYKQLLLKDLCARLPYGVIVETQIVNAPRAKYPELKVLQSYMLCDFMQTIENVIYKPYLRTMSSMTEEEKKEYYATMDKYTHRIYPDSCDFSTHTEYSWTAETFDWLNKKMFAYRTINGKDMFKLGLAIEAPKGMYKQT